MHSIKDLLNQPIDPLDAEVLLAHVLKKPKEYLFMNHKTWIMDQQAKKFLTLVEKRKQGWPVAYLINQKEFFGLKFFVNKSVLIPRPETEGLVELVLTQISNLKSPISILDIGTGSGNIIISLAKTLLANSHEYAHGHQFFASDISKNVLVVAKKNARLAFGSPRRTKQHGVKITFKQGDLLKPWLARRSLGEGGGKKNFDIIVANLPYLAEQTDLSTKFEPKKALVAKKNGLYLIKELFKRIAKTSSPTPPLKRRGELQANSQFHLSLLSKRERLGEGLSKQPQFIFLEIGHDQSSAIKKLAKKLLPAYDTKISKDLAGRTRYAVLAKKSF